MTEPGLQPNSEPKISYGNYEIIDPNWEATLVRYDTHYQGGGRFATVPVYSKPPIDRKVFLKWRLPDGRMFGRWMWELEAKHDPEFQKAAWQDWKRHSDV